MSERCGCVYPVPGEVRWIRWHGDAQATRVVFADYVRCNQQATVERVDGLIVHKLCEAHKNVCQAK